ncbi:MAG: NUDIX domain-containing protein [Patescibacteria group bacterium]
MKKDALFCVGQKAFIEKDGKVLVLNDPKGGLDFPGGKIQEGEAKLGDVASLTNALKREVREETNLEVEVQEPFVVWYHEFAKDHRNFGKLVYIVGFRCAYVSGDIKLSDEHDRFTWIEAKDFERFDDGSDFSGALKKYFKL